MISTRGPKQIEQELSDAHELPEHASMARLAYNGLDGRPRVIPIGIFWSERTSECGAIDKPRMRQEHIAPT